MGRHFKLCYVSTQAPVATAAARCQWPSPQWPATGRVLKVKYIKHSTEVRSCFWPCHLLGRRPTGKVRAILESSSESHGWHECTMADRPASGGLSNISILKLGVYPGQGHAGSLEGGWLQSGRALVARVSFGRPSSRV